MGNSQCKDAGESTWSANFKVSKTIQYDIVNGGEKIVKTTGVSPNQLKYEVDKESGEMSLVNNDGTTSYAGIDGNIKQALVVLHEMMKEMRGYPDPELED